MFSITPLSFDNTPPATMSLYDLIFGSKDRLDTKVQDKENLIDSIWNRNLPELLTDKDWLSFHPEKFTPKNAAAPIENGTWEVDWTMHGDQILGNIPQWVNTVNVFVGGFDPNNNYKIDSRSELDQVIPPTSPFYNPQSPTETYLQQFVAKCHAQGLTVKMSLGGRSAGWCGSCWDALKSQGVQNCANTILEFCKTNQLDGIDFDFEEWNQTDQTSLEQSVGALIKAVKAQNPALQTSLCTNAGFSTWQEHMKNILDASKDQTGKCGVDRMYIMSYYDPQSSEETWVGQWAKWLEQNYQFAPSQISVGLDDVDAHAYDIAQFAQWAESQGYSTCYWAWGWNGGNPTQSNDSTKKIWDIYHSANKL